MPYRVFELLLGTALVSLGVFIVVRFRDVARTIREYYEHRAESETARGWLGKTLFLPGVLTTSAMTLALALFVLVFGGWNLFSALANR